MELENPKDMSNCMLISFGSNINSLFAEGDWSPPIYFENSLYPDQAQQNVGPDQDPNSLTL